MSISCSPASTDSATDLTGVNLDADVLPPGALPAAHFDRKKACFFGDRTLVFASPGDPFEAIQACGGPKSDLHPKVRS
jgi:hypothetical protein